MLEFILLREFRDDSFIGCLQSLIDFQIWLVGWSLLVEVPSDDSISDSDVTLRYWFMPVVGACYWVIGYCGAACQRVLGCCVCVFPFELHCTTYHAYHVHCIWLAGCRLDSGTLDEIDWCDDWWVLDVINDVGSVYTLCWQRCDDDDHRPFEQIRLVLMTLLPW